MILSGEVKKSMIKEYFTKRGQALQLGCLLHMRYQVQAICCRIGKFKGYFRLKVVYVQTDATTVQHFVVYIRHTIVLL